ncbi:hypothetical protein QR680_005381 [Steinernema hermaphroditum]|uniref:glucuronosyltransferase n=1 Tax=Steinernema hermaphroditum TaxID=289476 RepID=A0AA39HRT5_9BILA|nr:hypothetical protein QR680_005381 [Steinernema hermaphroditum]
MLPSVVCLCLLPLLGSADPEGVAFTYTHAVSSSHLAVVFNVASKLRDFDVYDVRWPIMEAVANFKSPSGFRSIVSERAMKHSSKMKEMVDGTGWESSGGEMLSIFRVLSSAISLIFMPCDFEDSIEVEQPRPLNLSLIDPFTSLCAVARARQLHSRFFFVSPLVEPMSIAMLSGGELPIAATASVLVAKAPSKMTLLDRAANVFAHAFFELLVGHQLSVARLLFGPNPFFAPVEPSFVFINTHRILDFPVPRTFARVDFASRRNVLGDTPPTPLDDDLLQFIEDPTWRRVSVFSMSTYTNDAEMPAHLIEVFSEAFSHFPNIGFVWRIKELDAKHRRKNVKVVQWIPQRTLFEHPKTGAVISHCGQNSFLEAVQAGVPIFCIPMMGDQHLQSAILLEHGIGVVSTKAALDVETVVKSLHEVLNNEGIHRRSNHLKEMLKMEEEHLHGGDVLWWLRYYLRHTEQQFQSYVFPNRPESQFMENLFAITILGAVFIVLII